MSGASGPPRRPAPTTPGRRRGRALLPTVIIAGVLLLMFSIFTGIYTDFLWFQSVGYESVFTKELTTKTLLFFVFGLLFAIAVAVNFVVAWRTRPAYQALIPGQQELDRYRMAIDPFRRYVVLAVVALLGLIAGSSASSEWRTYLQWRNGQPFGVKDPQFGMDISFFAFDLPWWRFVLSFAFATVVLCLIAAAVTHYLYGGLRLQATFGERATPAARVHLSVLLGTFVLLKAIAYWLDRYSLAVKEDRIGRADFTGLTYTDVEAVLFGKLTLSAISVICAILFFTNIFRRTWLLPGLGVGLLLLSALLVGGVYPAVVQRFQVKPAEPDREAPYIQRNIEATRTAYNIDDIDVQDYSAKTDVTAGQLREDSDTTASIRLLDPAVLSPTYRNLQQIRAYYDFPPALDVDRYTVDDERRDLVTAVRELDLEAFRPSSATGSTTTRSIPTGSVSSPRWATRPSRAGRRSCPPTSRRRASSGSSSRGSTSARSRRPTASSADRRAPSRSSWTSRTTRRGRASPTRRTTARAGSGSARCGASCSSPASTRRPTSCSRTG